MQVIGNVSMRTFQDVSSSQKISTLGTREVSGYASSFFDKKRSKAKIKFKKIKGNDKLLAPVGLEDEYYYEEKLGVLENIKQYFNIVDSKKDTGNFFLSGISEQDDELFKYFSACYLLTEIEAGEPRVGQGTEALQGLVEKSLLDTDTQGRVILFVSQIAPEDTSCKFFYKLGFRYADEEVNKLVNDAIEKNLVSLQVPEGYMYLPKANIQKLLRYGHLF